MSKSAKEILLEHPDCLLICARVIKAGKLKPYPHEYMQIVTAYPEWPSMDHKRFCAEILAEHCIETLAYRDDAKNNKPPLTEGSMKGEIKGGCDAGKPIGPPPAPEVPSDSDETYFLVGGKFMASGNPEPLLQNMPLDSTFVDLGGSPTLIRGRLVQTKMVIVEGDQ